MVIQMIPIMVLGLAMVAYLYTRTPARIKPAGSRNLKGWHKLFGAVALILAVLIVVNPEFLALGLLGDTAFFDALVLLLGLQLQMIAAQAWTWCRAVSSRMLLRIVARMSLSFSVIVLTLAPVGDMFSAIHKTLHRLTS
jgi:hypothetical protein